MTYAAIDIEAILNGPDYVRCERLMGRWHLRQCAINRARGRHDPYSPYILCVNCPNAREAEARFGKPTKITDIFGFNYFPTITLEDDMTIPEPLDNLAEELTEINADFALEPEPEPAPEPEVTTEPEPAVVSAPKPPRMCKHHPDRPARLNKLGRSTGLCEECLRANIMRVGNHLSLSQPAEKKTEEKPSPVEAEYLAEFGWTPAKENLLADLLPRHLYEHVCRLAHQHYRTPYCQFLYDLQRLYSEVD